MTYAISSSTQLVKKKENLHARNATLVSDPCGIYQTMLILWALYYVRNLT